MYDGEASAIENGLARATNFGKNAVSVQIIERNC